MDGGGGREASGRGGDAASLRSHGERPGAWEPILVPEWALREWYVLAVWAGRERTIAAALRDRLGLTLYMPWGAEMRTPRNSRKHRGGTAAKVRVECPALAGYLFLGLGEDDWRRLGNPWRLLLASPLVTGYLGALAPDGERYPIRIRWAEVEAIGIAEDMGLLDTQLHFALGDRVEIETGPFAGMAATIEVVHNKKELTVGLSAGAAVLPLRLPVANVRRLG